MPDATFPKPSRRRRPLSVLSKALREASDEAAVQALIDSLEGDERAGARALRQRAQRRLAAERAERARLAGLLALRDELAAGGVRGIAGVDEVGVGPLAGPVVAAAVILPARVSLAGLDDSKRVRPALRRSLAREIRTIAVGVGLGEVEAREIDRMGIYQAALEAMRRAVVSLAREAAVGHLLVDARRVPGVSLPQTPIVKGDAKDASIAAASIVAKVHRDGLMARLGEAHPGYGFEQHMGYGTAAHLAALARFGPCPVHRRSFAPVAEAERRHGPRPGSAAP